jgi:hypothetical protein
MTPGQAFWRGVATALVVALPAAVFNQLLVAGGDIEEGSPWVLLFWVLILFGAAAGGWAVIRLSPGAALSYAAGAAATAYVLVQSIGVVRRLVAGDPLSWIAFPFLAVLMATVGMLGGMFARRSMRQYAPGPAEETGD